MGTKQEYLIRAGIRDFTLTGRVREIDAPAEGHVTLDVKVDGVEMSLECFLDYDDAISFYVKKFGKGDIVSVKLFLGGDYTKSIMLNNKIKDLRWIEHPPLLHPAYTSERYVARGEIVEIKPHPEISVNNIIILDCGIFVYTGAVKTAPLKVGDYMQMEGRLDAHIVGKVN